MTAVRPESADLDVRWISSVTLPLRQAPSTARDGECRVRSTTCQPRSDHGRSRRLTANIGIRFDKNDGPDQSGNVVAKDSA